VCLHIKTGRCLRCNVIGVGIREKTRETRCRGVRCRVPERNCREHGVGLDLAFITEHNANYVMPKRQCVVPDAKIHCACPCAVIQAVGKM